MSSSMITVKQGDYGPDATLAFTLTDPNSVITSLSGKTISLLVFNDPANPIINAACVFDSGMNFHYVPLVTDYISPGIYTYEIEIDGIASGRLSGVSGTFIIQSSPTH